MGEIFQLEGAKDFPGLDSLLSYFHQDCYIYGGKLQNVITEFTTDTAPDPEIARRAHTDIVRFMVERPDDKKLGEDFERMFNPDIRAEGWEKGVTDWRQWLTHVSELLKVSIPQEVAQ